MLKCEHSFQFPRWFLVLKIVRNHELPGPSPTVPPIKLRPGPTEGLMAAQIPYHFKHAIRFWSSYATVWYLQHRAHFLVHNKYTDFWINGSVASQFINQNFPWSHSSAAIWCLSCFASYTLFKYTTQCEFHFY